MSEGYFRWEGGEWGGNMGEELLGYSHEWSLKKFLLLFKELELKQELPESLI